jgi:Secretion system C-terminal sorting domain
MFKNKTIIALLFLLGFALCASAHQDGPPDGYCGNISPDQTCVVCHNSYPINSGPGGFNFQIMGGFYLTSQKYSLALTCGQGDSPETWGFQMTTVDGDGTQASQYLVVDSLLTSLSFHSGYEVDYFGHSFEGTLRDTSFVQWFFDWISPAVGTDTVFTYLSVIAGNGDGTAEGDYVYTRVIPTREMAVTAPGPFIHLIDEFVDFGYTPLGETRIITKRFFNVGSETLGGGFFAFSAADQTFFISDVESYVLAPYEDAYVNLAFAPESNSFFIDSLSVYAGSFVIQNSPFFVVGHGTPPLAPEPFMLISPDDNSTVTGSEIEFVWQNTLNLDSYNQQVDFSLEISMESDFFESLIFDVGADSSFTLSSDNLEDLSLYFWRVFAHDDNTEGRYSNEIFVLFTDFEDTGILQPSNNLPNATEIASIYPNPFNSSTLITLDLKNRSNIKAVIFDVLGREITTLHEGLLGTGTHKLIWSGNGVSGLYFIKVSDDRGWSAIRKLIYLN